MASLPVATNVQARATSSKSIIVTWSVPKVADIVGGSTHGARNAGAFKFSFRVLRRRKGLAAFVVAHQQDDTYDSHEITGLRPNCEYEIAVQTFSTGQHRVAAAKAGVLPTTEPVPCRTLEDVPTAPRSLHATHVTTDTITVAWKPPGRLNGTLRGYRLFFDQAKEEEFNVVELTPGSTSYTARHLYPITPYRFQILAFTSAGEGPCTHILTQRTRDSALNRFKLQGGDDWVQGETVVDDDDDDAGSDVDDDSDNDAKVGAVVRRNQANDPSATRAPAKPVRRGFCVVAPTSRPTPNKAPASSSNGRQMQSSSSSSSRPVMRRLNEDDWRAMFFSKDQGQRATSHVDVRQPAPPQLQARSASSADVTRTRTRRPLSLIPPVRGQQPSPSVSVPSAQSRTNTTPKRRVHPQAEAFSSPSSSPSPSNHKHSPTEELAGLRTVSRGAVTNERQPTTADQDVAVAEGVGGEDQLIMVRKRNKARTIRGKKHGVRKTLQQLKSTYDLLSSTELSRLFDEESKTKRVVLYVTNTTAIRDTFQACEEIKALFYNLRVRVDLRNIAMDKQARSELERRLPGAVVPQAFLEGRHLGDAKALKEMNETGALRRRLADCEERPLTDCTTCGGQGYILCTWCQGSKRSLLHGFGESTKEEWLKCSVCNENALQRCPDC
ncbi:hypothetical protein PTSG_01173 [Salpingoeca rosetta]|uniref:Fibronectin type-III domain-containing protein n=1 Tax=Salpingoeca rosetta (strain ATCC 50818 / BSB-021) TaxID=946362 RepID=F2U107_SALR5|nr:uncharacterized protein PTSG_01173 [Salpingoeca rosetta]EGD80581.1 hypothetical protein PTSG_01173 [Salpingoeca rosetta]|eukprot:XP_004997142.1 hypothetical protein PTSG_01173 [Salpingoeca rosetta]